MTKIAVIYVRCSTREQEKDGYSLEYQVEKCKEYIEAKEYAYYKTYTDSGISGTTPSNERPGMSVLINDVKSKKFDVIVFHAFDRLARKMTVAYQIIGVFEEYGITIAECQNNIDTSTSDGQTRMAMYFTFAQMEHGAIKERSKLGRNIRKKKLGWLGGPVPFGYVKPDDNKDSLPIIEENEAKTVRLIYQLYWKDGYPVSKIPILLDSQKIPSGKYNKGTGWNMSMVKRILKDHQYKYNGNIINDNEYDLRWPKILDKEYPIYPKTKSKNFEIT